MSEKEQLRHLLAGKRGHFVLESGHHGELWLDLPLLCLRPAAIRPLATTLAAAVSQHRVEAICGPLVEGAFVAMMVAEALDVPFTYSERRDDGASAGLFPVGYVVPRPLRPQLTGRRVAIINDVINAGSAVRGTLGDLRACGAETVVIGALATLGSHAAQLAAAAGLPLETLVTLPNQIWAPADCPLCARQLPLSARGE